MDASSPETRQLDDELLKCFQAVFPALSDDEIRTVRKADFDQWDSLASLSLVTVIEEEFRVRLDDAAVTQLESFDEARTVLQREGRASGPS